jgi:multimeric flavodoxin WrbA
MAAKRVMFICGSPNANGNTRTVVDWVAEGAHEAGHEVEIIDAARLDYGASGCAACMGCRKSDEYRCVVEDGATPVIASIPEQDVVVFATPVYFMGFSAQLKLLIDRMFSLGKVRDGEYELAPGLETTRFAVVATAGGGMDDGLDLVKANMEAITRWFGTPAKSFLVPGADGDDGVRGSNTELRDRARAFGRGL